MLRGPPEHTRIPILGAAWASCVANCPAFRKSRLLLLIIIILLVLLLYRFGCNLSEPSIETVSQYADGIDLTHILLLVVHACSCSHVLGEWIDLLIHERRPPRQADILLEYHVQADGDWLARVGDQMALYLLQNTHIRFEYLSWYIVFTRNSSVKTSVLPGGTGTGCRDTLRLRPTLFQILAQPLFQCIGLGLSLHPLYKRDVQGAVFLLLRHSSQAMTTIAKALIVL